MTEPRSVQQQHAADKPVTIVITPRDRYTGIIECINTVYKCTSVELFDLVVLDLGYPAALARDIQAACTEKPNMTVITDGRIIPMEALRRYRERIATRYTVLLDNDSRVTPGWLEPLIETAESQGAAVVSPLTLEKAGVDEGAELRNHLYTNEIRVVAAEGESRLIEHKSYRRSLPEEVPAEIRPTQAFELHCVFFRTATLQAIEIPQMTIREHLDIGMQLKARGEQLVADPRSVIHFDNLGTRAALSDLLYFNLRWNGRVTYDSSRLFEKRWGYKFYSEESIYNWAIRRRLFLLLRWLHLPIGLANKVDKVFSAIRRRLFPIWDPLPDPIGNSTLLYETVEGGAPKQLSHAVA
ncbi:glycosyltransferase [Haliea sp. E1-2-M8]|uniref:glycosyltransferase family 2 protein n=1 Tax=Haliea sp. E1-2-M8 TaxID=3064706 RepID=UPI002717494D|nr:glycosyltransferase [Haliea sp. E1-2-M8]MDO8863770.1 glycosyltransferase [Haliea sp. E1-2-M8]